MFNRETILIIDFGSQFTQLIARRIRESKVYCEIHSHMISIEEIKKLNPIGIILSGGPMSVYDENSPALDNNILSLQKPILGICYGLQILCKNLGGKVESAKDREYGKAELSIEGNSSLFLDVKNDSTVWMSHGDYLTNLPQGFNVIGTSHHSPICAIENKAKKIFGVQFHPEVVHTEEGEKIIRNFLFKICGAKGDWTPQNFIEESIDKIKSAVGNSKVICALSGGVDSTVAAVLVEKAIGDKLICIHIDNGLMRKNESEEVEKLFKDEYHIRFVHVNASEKFLSRLKGVVDPEQKRKIIGNTFIEVFEEEAKKIEGVKFLVQGTLYPDVIESVSVKGSSATIKTHHNVGGLPKKMHLKLIEPFRELFKDEVRNVGLSLNIPEDFIERHPFPGPGLAVRIIGEVTKEKLDLLCEADEIFINEIKAAGVYNNIWQAFAVLLPIQTVGVMGDARTYENVLALRAVTSVDGMTADWFRFDDDLLAKISNKIINKIRGINRIVYDISSKPPSTIEWE
ncbi:MAG: glutamine-hydrolyzing GMP synthase [Ignavibacteria bacterium RIFOXYB2_FULL_35_12]|nr:MAG: glutamine-hydrolyzing GMP synthase [Ignavibacteria bacterium GWA2_36_19]OGU61502.1 MAG: glutamine-hydrolyzing GMP synthase [Ignavibacteria bacterium GWF2_35_20]OGU85534.1 MAG: glutamine-hydrolyzing GMP synthase [Ignavibacteria bacterium RIFOXYA12_FULL_35_25]OGU90303.1 MAG: glutamine-hydrolyzing GMP synthase [Ignavibacteria bacterium RIFOXYC12_FULL_35_11]OGU96739.1 MAG: glutamine-hydrolyzing GMP synthase [Ignavibacteria bacterium RIFOXYB12_FULL_35_14]OGU98156.1 MAG: glutamine-hydrolyzin